MGVSIDKKGLHIIRWYFLVAREQILCSSSPTIIMYEIWVKMFYAFYETSRNGQSDDHQVSVIYVQLCDSELWYAYIFACSIEFSIPLFWIPHNKNIFFPFLGRKTERNEETFILSFVSNFVTMLKDFYLKPSTSLEDKTLSS